MDPDNPRKPRGIPARPSHSERWGHSRPQSDELKSVRLIRKFADMIDGVDLVHAAVGDRLDLSPRDAHVLIAEGWAEPESEDRPAKLPPRRAIAADSARNSRKRPKDQPGD